MIHGVGDAAQSDQRACSMSEHPFAPELWASWGEGEEEAGEKGLLVVAREKMKGEEGGQGVLTRRGEGGLVHA